MNLSSKEKWTRLRSIKYYSTAQRFYLISHNSHKRLILPTYLPNLQRYSYLYPYTMPSLLFISYGWKNLHLWSLPLCLYSESHSLSLTQALCSNNHLPPLWHQSLSSRFFPLDRNIALNTFLILPQKQCLSSPLEQICDKGVYILAVFISIPPVLNPHNTEIVPIKDTNNFHLAKSKDQSTVLTLL